MRSLISRRCGFPWAFSSRDSLLVEIIRSSATSVSSFPESSRSCFSALAMWRRGPSGPVTATRLSTFASPARKRACLPSWESHSAKVLSPAPHRRHTARDTRSGCLSRHRRTSAGRGAERGRRTYRGMAGHRLQFGKLHSGNPNNRACTTDFQSGHLMAVRVHIPPDVVPVAGRKVRAAGQRPGRSHPAGACPVVTEAARARAPPPRLRRYDSGQRAGRRSRSA